MEALEQLSVSYADVIITDIKMPEINGLDLINRIREKDENTKIIILSGYSDFSFAQRAIELGVTRYLTKPTNARELIGILEEIEKNIQKHRSEEKQEMKVTNLFCSESDGLHFYELFTKADLDKDFRTTLYHAQLFE